MLRQKLLNALLIVGGVFITGITQAQEYPLYNPANLAPMQNGAERLPPGFGTPKAERIGTPVETLESLTGEEVGEVGEEAEEIETDRDSFTPATTIAPRRRLITEVAYSFIDNRGVKETHSYPELLLRYGITERLELRLGWNYDVGGEGGDVSGTHRVGRGETGEDALERASNFNYGFKVRVTEQDGWIPGSAAIVQASTPTSGIDTATDLTLTYVAGWDFANRMKFDAAMRYQYARAPGDQFDVWAPSVVWKVPIGEKWAAHAEYFGIISTNKEDNFSRHYFSPGAHYLVTPNLEVGFRVGWGLTEETPRFFVNSGLGWLF